MKKVLFVLSTILMLTVIIVGATLSTSAEDVIQSGTWGDLSWELNQTTGELTISGNGAMGDFPASSTSAWRAYETSIKTVTIEDGVTSIGEWAFSYCSSLTSITIEDGVTSIGDGAFYGCSSLMSITIPNSVTSIGEYAFWNCSSLTSITIPNSVTSIGNDAFGGCTKLIYIENGVSYVDKWVVDCDTTVTTVSMRSDTVGIGERAFSYCSSLTSITIPNSVTSIGNSAFSSCSSLMSITVDEENTKYHSNGNCVIETESKILILGCENSVIPIDGSVTSIGYGAFLGCSGLTSITIPNSVTSIGNSAFSSCSSLTSITIPNSVTSIGNSAFSSCSSLTSITIPNSVTSIGSSTFSGCSGLTSITVDEENTKYHSNGNCLIETESKILILGCKNSVIPTDGSVTSIGDYAFSRCSSLMSITIPNSVTSIGISAFSSCSSLTSITIPNSVTSIGKYAFSGCSSLMSITIPNSVTSIGDLAFSGCSGLTSITIPNSVTSIGNDAFYGCTRLIYIENGVSYVDKWVVDCDTTVTTVSMRSDTVGIADSVFWGCSGLTSITIPNSVTSIGKYAFSGCSSLTSIIFCGAEEQWNAIPKGNYWDNNTGAYTLQYHDYVDGVCTICGEVLDDSATSIFDDSMQAYLNLENEVTMSIGYKLKDMDSIDANALVGRFGLLIWRADEVPEETTYENCSNIIRGAVYNAEKGRFETTTPGIAAKNLGDQFTFCVYFINDDGSYSYSRLISDYSPKTYCYRQIEDNPDDEKQIYLMASILNYGAAAQVHFEYRTDDLMNADLSAELQEMNWDGSLVRSDYSVMGNKDSAFVRGEAITSRGGYLDLRGAIDYNFYAKVDFEPVKATIYYWTEADVAALDMLTLENATSHEAMNWVEENSRWEGKYEGQAAKQMFNTIYACMVFEDAEGNVVYSGVVGYSPERYAYISQNEGNTNAELAKRLAIYGDAARKYFDQ